MKIRLFALCSLLCVLGAVLWFQVTTALRERREQMARLELAREHAKTLWFACEAYSKTHGNTYPPSAHWEEHLAQALHVSPSQMEELVSSPSRDSATPPQRFAFNTAVAGQPTARFSGSPSTVLFFESPDMTRNSSHKATSASPGTVGSKAASPVAVDVRGWAEVNNTLVVG